MHQQTEHRRLSLVWQTKSTVSNSIAIGWASVAMPMQKLFWKATQLHSLQRFLILPKARNPLQSP